MLHVLVTACVQIAASLGLPDLQPDSRFSSLIAWRASGKIMQKLTSQTIMNCADGIVKLNILYHYSRRNFLFSSYLNLTRATKNYAILALLTAMKYT